MSRNETIKQNKKFGYTVAIVLLLLAGFHIFIKHRKGWWVVFAIATALLLTALVKPALLSFLRLVWDKIGHVMGIFNTYVLLTLFYFLILTPLGLIMRLFGKDILKLKLKNKSGSYWENAAPSSGGMEN